MKKIQIGKTYVDERGNDFEVVKIEKGRPLFNSMGFVKYYSERVAINKQGERRKISKLK